MPKPKFTWLFQNREIGISGGCNRIKSIQIRCKFFWFIVIGLLGAIRLFAAGDDQMKHIRSTDTATINRMISKIARGGFSDEDEALTELKKISRASANIGYLKGRGEALFQAGVLEYRLNRYQRALDNFDSAYNVATQIHDTLLMAQSLERLASVNLSTGDDHLSLKLYYQSLPLFQSMENKAGIAKVYNIIGLYKSAQHEYDSAEDYYRKAIRLNKEVGNETGIVHNKGNLGYLYEKTGNFKEAGRLYGELVGMLIKSGDSLNLPVIYYNLSSLQQKQNHEDSVVYYLRRAMKIAEPRNDTSLLSALYGDYGQMMMDFGFDDSATFYLDKSVIFAHAIGEYSNELNALEALLSIDTLSGNPERAMDRFRRVLIIKDSIHARNARNNLKASELRYESQKNEERIRVKEMQLESANRQKRTYYLLLIMSFLVAVLLIAVIILIVKNNQKQRRIQNEELQLKDLQIKSAAKSEELHKIKAKQAEKEIHELAYEQISNSLALEQKTLLLNQTHRKLSEAIKDTGVLDQQVLNAVVSSIKAQHLDSSDVDLFNQKFSQLHKDFYENLKKAHPALTKSELKFCAYLKLNLSGSQIAKIQSVSTEAIRKSRYRIRKKLNLQREDSLEDYISGF